ncbi:hypothetical protein Tco_0397583 [Tanacetum coccineum]
MDLGEQLWFCLLFQNIDISKDFIVRMIQPENMNVGAERHKNWTSKMMKLCCQVITTAIQAEGFRLRAEGSDVNMTKRNRGRTLLMKKLLGILLLSKAQEDLQRLRDIGPTSGQRLPPHWAETFGRLARPICS